MVMCRDLITTQRLASKLISGPSPTAKTRLVSFNRTQSKVVTGLLTVRNTLKTHLYLTGRINSPYVDVEQRKKPQPMFCEFEALASHVYIRVPSS